LVAKDVNYFQVVFLTAAVYRGFYCKAFCGRFAHTEATLRKSSTKINFVFPKPLLKSVRH